MTEANRTKAKDSRIWIDGCFDFAHHGHAGAMLQARQLGKELFVGVHSDEEILSNKGPTVMTMDERLTAVEACKWSTKAISNAPYVTDPKFMAKYNCEYVVHGDDITTDANGNDCYQTVKDLGIFLVVKRTPNISTTDLVGRMLLMSKDHHYPNINQTIGYQKLVESEDNIKRYHMYASDETGLGKGSSVYIYTNDKLNKVIEGNEPIDKFVYIDGGFDVFHPGHIEILKIVKQKANESGAKVIVGLHDDLTVNKYKGLNYPIMNIFERSLCVLQCKYVDGIVLGAPYVPTNDFLQKLKGNAIKVFHGPTSIDDSVYSQIQPPIEFETIGSHKYDDMNTEFIVNRVLQNKQLYEERQKRKGWKSQIEKDLKDKE